MISAARLSDLAALVGRSMGLCADVERAAAIITEAINHGGKVLVCGNGGSAAQAQHFAAELVGRYKLERRALPAIALTTDTSALTAIANDYGYGQVFARQVAALGRAGDVLVALSTSGHSGSVIRAMRCADIIGVRVVAITGTSSRSREWTIQDGVHIAIDSADTALTQELTEHVLHSIAEIVEKGCA